MARPKTKPKFRVGDEVETSGTERGYARGFVTERYHQTGAWVYGVRNSKTIIRSPMKEVEHWWERQLQLYSHTITTMDVSEYEDIIQAQEVYEELK